ncbi:MAG: hypothetical protein NTY61_02945 [Candidatus Parcubacteria bacterium]|nr:hypothetical protein [Candidatus Parcubacteria bacterium]
MSIKKFKLIIFLFLAIVIVGQSLAVLAQSSTSSPGAPIQLTNPLKGGTDISAIIGGIIGWLLRFLGVLAFAMFVYGGILWMTSGGKADQVTKGRDTLVWAVAGLALVFFSYAILKFILTVLINK